MSQPLNSRIWAVTSSYLEDIISLVFSYDEKYSGISVSIDNFVSKDMTSTLSITYDNQVYRIPLDIKVIADVTDPDDIEDGIEVNNYGLSEFSVIFPKLFKKYLETSSSDIYKLILKKDLT